VLGCCGPIFIIAVNQKEKRADNINSCKDVAVKIINLKINLKKL